MTAILQKYGVKSWKLCKFDVTRRRTGIHSLRCSVSGAYPEVFRGRGFEIFLYGRENLGGGFGIFFLKNPSKLKNFSQKGGGFDPQNPSLNTPLQCFKQALISIKYTVELILISFKYWMKFSEYKIKTAHWKLKWL